MFFVALVIELLFIAFGIFALFTLGLALVVQLMAMVVYIESQYFIESLLMLLTTGILISYFVWTLLATEKRASEWTSPDFDIIFKSTWQLLYTSISALVGLWWLVVTMGFYIEYPVLDFAKLLGNDYIMHLADIVKSYNLASDAIFPVLYVFVFFSLGMNFVHKLYFKYTSKPLP